MPGEACLNGPVPTADVTMTWSPQTIGDDQARPGTSALQATLIVVDHVAGRLATSDTARPAWPRNCGQLVSGGAGAGRRVVRSIAVANETIRCTRAVYNRAPCMDGLSSSACSFAFRSTESRYASPIEMHDTRLLVVEDNTDLRRLFRTTLSMAGYHVDEAGDGLEALRMIENRTPDLVVLDLTLHTLDGLSVQQELAAGAITSNIPIVIVTGSNLDVDGANVACVLRKPVAPDKLVRTVKQCLVRGTAAGV